MSYQRLTIYFFTGTGNSYRAAGWMAQTAADQGARARVVPMREARPDEDSGGGPEALIGLVTPTHGFTAPWHAIHFALRLPPGRGTHAFVMPTRAGTKLGRAYLPGMEGTAGYLLALILALKGYAVRGVQALDMPSNWMALHPSLSKASVDGIVERGQARATAFIETILKGDRHFGGRVPLLLGLALLPASLGYLLIGRFFLARLMFANGYCTGCGICVRNCPTGSLKIWQRTGRPYWTYTCEGCMRCMSYCPVNAVEAGHSWGVLLYYVGSLPVVAFAFDRLATLVPGLTAAVPDWARAVLDYGYKLLAFYLCYVLFTLLIRLPAANRLFSVTTLTHYYRRYRVPGATLKELTRSHDAWDKE